jgi:hypothetical protein
MIARQGGPIIHFDMPAIQLQQLLSIRTTILERFIEAGPTSPKVPRTGKLGKRVRRRRRENRIRHFEQRITRWTKQCISRLTKLD